ncbi:MULTISPECIES: DUF6479 family protein [unclassified Streptomyces]|uniref:DUF6479 family protein n=1 Tax=unclassified Streptomyces TaxID=2593676 RepID=UPI00332C8EED
MPLAASGTSSLMLIIGVVIVAVLLALFLFGRRQVTRRPDPPQEPQPRADSWEEPHQGPPESR